MAEGPKWTKVKIAEGVATFALATALVVASAYQLGVFGVTTMQTVHKDAAQAGSEICKQFASKYGYTVESVDVRAGVVVGSSVTDTLICNFQGGHTIPYVLIYNQQGELVDYQ